VDRAFPLAALALLALAACSPPATPIGATVFHYDATGTEPADVVARLRPLAPVHDGCAVALQDGREEVRLVNTATRDPTTGRYWLQTVVVNVSKNPDARIDVEEVRPMSSTSPDKSDGVCLRVFEHDVGGSFTVADVCIAGDGSCPAR
jgi:hypothetical protein